MSDGLNEALKGNTYSHTRYKKIPTTSPKTKNIDKMPDQKWHRRISFIKSAIRLGACAFGFFGLYELGFIGLFLAELVGIGEELV